MSKVLIYSLVSIICLLIVGFLIFTLTIDRLVKSGIEEVGTEMTGTEVWVASVSISAFSGRGTINGFHVANPEGFSREDALIIDEFFIELDLMTLFSDEIIVREITINAPAIFMEQKLPENNLQSILRHINETTSFEASDSELVIERFLMMDGIVELHSEVGGERTARFEISAIELHDLGRQEGRNAAEDVIQQITERIVEKAVEAAVRSGSEQLKDAIRDIFN